MFEIVIGVISVERIEAKFNTGIIREDLTWHPKYFT
jgi:hypothetical protein